MPLIDTQSNISSDTRLSVYSYTVSNIGRDALVSAMTGAGYGDVLFVTKEGNKKTVYFIGNQLQIGSAATYADSADKAS